MRNLEIEIETIQIGIYSNIVLNLLQTHELLSINKVMLFSYLIKKDKFRWGKVYTANNSKDVVYKAISLMTGEYAEYCENVGFILKAIHFLHINDKVEINETFLKRKEDVEIEKSIYQESAFINKAIEESKKITDRQFMKEVIANV